MQMIRLCCVAVVLAFGWSGAAPNAAAEQAKPDAKPAEAKKAEPTKPEPKQPAAKKTAAKKTDKKPEPKADNAEPKAAADPKPSAPKEPATVAFDKLPKDIKSLHSCAKSGDQRLEISSEKYARSVVFFVSCPVARGALTLLAIYSAKDARGAGAKRVKFEVPGLNGGDPIAVDALPSAIAAREAYTKPDDVQPNTRTKDDVAWITGAWGPDDRPGVCAVSGQWRIEGDKAALFLWEEARDCPKNELPKYETKVDKKPPPLVQR